MNAFASAILWMTVQVLLFSLIGGAVFFLLRRRGPVSAGACAAMVLGLTLPLVLIMVSPWPRWISNSEMRMAKSEDGSHSDIGNAQNAVGSLRSQSNPATETSGTIFTTISAWWRAATQELQPNSDLGGGANLAAPAWQTWIPWIFAVGIGFGLFRLIAGLWAVEKLRRSSLPIEDVEIKQLIRDLGRQLNAPDFGLRESELLRSAATVGWRQPVVLLPANWREWTDTQRRVVLAHELVHIARRDYFSGLVARVAMTIHFYQPLVLWLGRQLRIQQELAADGQAAAVVGDRQSYLATLAQLALRADEAPLPWAARAFLPGTSMLIRRVAWLKRGGSKVEKTMNRKGRWLLGTVMVLVALVVAGIRGPSGSNVPLALAAPPEEKQLDRLPKELHQIGNARPADSKGLRTFEFVPADAKLVFAISPGEVIKLTSVEKFAALFEKDTNFEKKYGIKVSDVADVEVVRTRLVIPSPGPQYDRFIVRTQAPHDWKQTLLRLGGDQQGPAIRAEKLEGKEYFVVDPSGPSFYIPDDRTLIFGPKEEILKIVRGGEELMKASDFPEFQSQPVAVRADMSILKAMAGLDKLPKDFESNPAVAMFLPLIDHVKVEYGYAGVDMQAAGSVGFHARFVCDSTDGAQQVAKTLEALRTVGLNLLQAKMQAWRQSTPAEATAEQVGQINQFFDMAVKSLTDAKISSSNQSVEVSTRFDLNQSVIAGFLMPAVAASREAAMRSQSMNNLKQLALAMYNFLAAKKHFPPAAIRDKDGKQLLSWRVAILPFLEEDSLYKEFHLDEPWDSEHNKTLIAKMPAVFRDPHENHASTNSSYFMPRGKGLFGGSEEGWKMSEVTDGKANTIMLVEAKRDIPWTKPEDIEIDDDLTKPLPPFGGNLETANFLAGFADGHVQVISNNADPNTLRASLMVNWRDVVDEAKLNPQPADRSWDKSPGSDAPAANPPPESSGSNSMKIEFHRAENQPAVGLSEAVAPDGPNVKIYVHPEAELTNADFAEATATTDDRGQPVVSISFTAAGAEKMAKLTEDN
ncbi:MAG TPA: DUF1559 domain-containing protein, partial [Pirellulales bacterium]